MRPRAIAMSASCAIVLLGAAGCLLTADFERFDTSPAQEVAETGAPTVLSGTVTLTLKDASPTILVRPAKPGTIAVHVERAGNAPHGPVTVRAELATGLTASEVVFGPEETDKPLTITLADARDGGASLYGRVVPGNVVGTVTDPVIKLVGPPPFSVEVWGAPGEVDPTRVVGTLKFVPDHVQRPIVGGLCIRCGDFVGAKLGVVDYHRLLLLDGAGAVETVDLDALPDLDPRYLAPGSLSPDGDIANVVTTTGQSTGDPVPPLTTTVRRGKSPSALATGTPFLGSGCIVDREGLRIACQDRMTGNTPLQNLVGGTPGATVHPVSGYTMTTLLHTKRGWLLAGAKFPTPPERLPGGNILELVDDDGAAVPTFAYEPETLAGTGVIDVVADDAGVFVAGGYGIQPSAMVSNSARIARLDWTGKFVPSFGTDGKVLLPAIVAVRLLSTANGLLVLSVKGPMFDSGATVTRIDPKTGTIDPTFGKGGAVTLPGLMPIASKEIGNRLAVAVLTTTGASVTYLFP